MAKKKQKSASRSKPAFALNPLHYVLLIFIPFLVYGRALFFGFVMHDDDKMILENGVVKEGINPAVAFKTDAWFMNARIELYRPWQSITYMLDHAIGGDHAVIYHLHNLLVFMLGVGLLSVFLRYYFKPVWAWAGTMLYSVNLLAPHAVSWIAARGDLYLMVFGLLFLILLKEYQARQKAGMLWAAVPAFFLALCSKESAVALWPVAFVILYAEHKKWPKTNEWIWLIVNGLVFAGFFMLRKGAIADVSNLYPVSFFSNLRTLPEEFFKMILPFGFSVMPGYNIMITVCGVLLTVAFAYMLTKHLPDRKILWAGLAILLLSLLPSMLYDPSFAKVAYDYLDHRAWFPFVGLWMVVLGLAASMKWDEKKWATAVFVSILVVWSCVNIWRSGTYSGWETYYANAIKTNPGSGLANLNYGSMLRDQGKWEEALPYVEKGEKLSPKYTDAKVRLSEIYYTLKRYPEAIAMADAALAEEPNNVSALQFKGSALGANKQTQAAVDVFKKILEIEPENPHGMFNLGVAYKESNELNKAVESFSALLIRQPDFPNAYFERGFCYGRMGMFPLAKDDLDKSIEKQPDHGTSYFFRGRALDALGDLEGACADWRKALELGVPDAEPFVKNRCGG